MLEMLRAQVGDEHEAGEQRQSENHEARTDQPEHHLLERIERRQHRRQMRDAPGTQPSIQEHEHQGRHGGGEEQRRGRHGQENMSRELPAGRGLLDEGMSDPRHRGPERGEPQQNGADHPVAGLG